MAAVAILDGSTGCWDEVPSQGGSPGPVCFPVAESLKGDSLGPGCFPAAESPQGDLQEPTCSLAAESLG